MFRGIESVWRCEIEVIKFLFRGQKYSIPSGIFRDVWMDYSCNPNTTLRQIADKYGMGVTKALAITKLLQAFGYVERVGQAHAVKVNIPLYPAYNGVVQIDERKKDGRR